MVVWCQRHFERMRIWISHGYIYLMCANNLLRCYSKAIVFFLLYFVGSFLPLFIIFFLPLSLSNTQCYTKRCVIKSLVCSPSFLFFYLLPLCTLRQDALQSSKQFATHAQLHAKIISLIKLLNHTKVWEYHECKVCFCFYFICIVEHQSKRRIGCIQK